LLTLKRYELPKEAQVIAAQTLQVSCNKWLTLKRYELPKEAQVIAAQTLQVSCNKWLTLTCFALEIPKSPSWHW